MGLFNRSEKTTGRSRRTTKTPEPEFEFSLAQAAKIFGIAAWVFTILFVGAGWYWGVPYLEDRVAANDRSPLLIEFSHDLVPVENIEHHLTQLALGAAYSSVEMSGGAAEILRTEDMAVQRVRDVMAGTGWFEPGVKVHRDLVKRDGSLVDRFFIDGPFRQPFALVRHGGLDHLVDEHGIVLPPRYPAEDNVDVLIRLEGVRSAAPSVGQAWPGGDVEDGLGLIAFLQERNPLWLDQVAAVEVSNFDGSHKNRNRPRLVIKSINDLEIGWGRAVGREGGIEHSADDKLRLIDLDFMQRKMLGHTTGMLMVNLNPSTIDR